MASVDDCSSNFNSVRAFNSKHYIDLSIDESISSQNYTSCFSVLTSQVVNNHHGDENIGRALSRSCELEKTSSASHKRRLSSKVESDKTDLRAAFMKELYAKVRPTIASNSSLSRGYFECDPLRDQEYETCGSRINSFKGASDGLDEYSSADRNTFRPSSAFRSDASTLYTKRPLDLESEQLFNGSKQCNLEKKTHFLVEHYGASYLESLTNSRSRFVEDQVDTSDTRYTVKRQNISETDLLEERCHNIDQRPQSCSNKSDAGQRPRSKSNHISKSDIALSDIHDSIQLPELQFSFDSSRRYIEELQDSSPRYIEELQDSSDSTANSPTKDPSEYVSATADSSMESCKGDSYGSPESLTMLYNDTNCSKPHSRSNSEVSESIFITSPNISESRDCVSESDYIAGLAKAISVKEICNNVNCEIHSETGPKDSADEIIHSLTTPGDCESKLKNIDQENPGYCFERNSSGIVHHSEAPSIDEFRESFETAKRDAMTRKTSSTVRDVETVGVSRTLPEIISPRSPSPRNINKLSDRSLGLHTVSDKHRFSNSPFQRLSPDSSGLREQVSPVPNFTDKIYNAMCREKRQFRFTPLSHDYYNQWARIPKPPYSSCSDPGEITLDNAPCQVNEPRAKTSLPRPRLHTSIRHELRSAQPRTDCNKCTSSLKVTFPSMPELHRPATWRPPPGNETTDRLSKRTGNASSVNRKSSSANNNTALRMRQAVFLFQGERYVHNCPFLGNPNIRQQPGFQPIGNKYSSWKSASPKQKLEHVNRRTKAEYIDIAEVKAVNKRRECFAKKEQSDKNRQFMPLTMPFGISIV